MYALFSVFVRAHVPRVVRSRWEEFVTCLAFLAAFHRDAVGERPCKEVWKLALLVSARNFLNSRVAMFSSRLLSCVPISAESPFV
jgi:hypothetical protein